MYKSATKCNETIGKWCKNKHGASKIIDTFETYQRAATEQGGWRGGERVTRAAGWGSFRGGWLHARDSRSGNFVLQDGAKTRGKDFSAAAFSRAH
jgi:hypothetical protein